MEENFEKSGSSNYNNKFYVQAFYKETGGAADEGFALSTIEIEQLEETSVIDNGMGKNVLLSHYFQKLLSGEIQFFVCTDALLVYKSAAQAYVDAEGFRLSTFRYFDEALCSEKTIFFLFSRVGK